MPSKKATRKAKQRRRQAATRLERQERPKRYWLRRKARMALLHVRHTSRRGWRYLRPTGKVFWGLVVLVATVLGVYEVLTPRFSFSQVDPLNPADPMSLRVTVRNSGYFSLYNVNATCGVHHVISEGGASVKNLEMLTVPRQFFAEIGSDEAATIRCPFSSIIAFESPVKSADIQLLLEYRPSFVWWRQRRDFRLVTERASDGKLRWVEQPAENKF